MKKLFFVIPVYKVENFLKRCVESVLNQTYPDVKIILVDDGSPDNCPKICDDFAKKFHNIAVIHKQNGGLSDARNAGIRRVLETAGREDYITFLDSDDYVHRDYAKAMIELCEKNLCGAVQSNYEKGEDNAFSDNAVKKNIEIMPSEKALLGYRLKSQACAKVYKVKLFENLLFPIDKINEDEFVTYRAIFGAEKVGFTDENLYYYFQHGSGIMADVAKKLKDNPHRYDFLEAYKERTEFFEEKNMPDQVMKTREKICTDMILRYCEQMYLKKEDRDIDCVNGTYMKIYRENFRMMIKRPGIPPKRKAMYILFNIAPMLGVIAGKVFKMRK